MGIRQRKLPLPCSRRLATLRIERMTAFYVRRENSPDASRAQEAEILSITYQSPRNGIRLLLLAALIAPLAGCIGAAEPASELEKVWGRPGISEGRFRKPRAIACDAKDRLYVVDMTARIQVFDADGNYLSQWETPTHENGRPTGLNIDRDGNLLVADTHYFQLLIYSPEGKLLRKIGGTHGHGPGNRPRD